MGEPRETSADAEHESEDEAFDALLREVAHVPEGDVPDSATLTKGTMVTDRVRLVKPLGRGGMGVVWLADHLTLDRRVAVKFVRSAGRSLRKRIEREAQLAAKLDDPHAVRIFDHGAMPDGTPFIVMELLDGVTLAERIADVGALPIEDVVTLGRQLAQVLGEAHDAGIVHRDLKPSNVFLTHSGDELFVKLMDFGIAKRITDPTTTTVTIEGSQVGTPLYMAPEQLVDGEPGTVASDLWSLAAVLYEAMTGAAPFEGKTVAALGMAVSESAFEPPTARRASLPSTMDAWAERAFAREPSRRFASARALVDALVACLDEPPAKVGARRAAPRHKMLLAALAVLAVAAVALASLRGETVPSETASVPASTEMITPEPEVTTEPSVALELGAGATATEAVPAPSASATTSAKVAGRGTPRSRPAQRGVAATTASASPGPPPTPPDTTGDDGLIDGNPY